MTNRTKSDWRDWLERELAGFIAACYQGQQLPAAQYKVVAVSFFGGIRAAQIELDPSNTAMATAFCEILIRHGAMIGEGQGNMASDNERWITDRYGPILTRPVALDPLSASLVVVAVPTFGNTFEYGVGITRRDAIESLRERLSVERSSLKKPT